MPHAVHVVLVGLAQGGDAVAGQQLVEALAVQDIEDGPGAAARAHLLHGRLVERAPVVGEGSPVGDDAFLGGEAAEIVDEARAPVDDGAEHVEQQGLDMGFGWHGFASSVGNREWGMGSREQMESGELTLLPTPYSPLPSVSDPEGLTPICARWRRK